jgi:hypothetical protein
MITRHNIVRLLVSPLAIALVVSAGFLGVVFLVAPHVKAGETGSGKPSFTEQVLGPRIAESRAVVIATDLDGDQKPDIVTGDDSGQNYVYSSKDGFLSGRPFGTGTDTTRSLAVGDVNNDGALDIIVGNYQQQSMVYLNPLDTAKHPTGQFLSKSTIDCDANDRQVRCFGVRTDATTSVAVAQIDGRKDIKAGLDIVVGNDDTGNKDKIYINNGTGVFEKTSNDCSDTSKVRCFGLPDSTTTKVAIQDMNGDNANDIIVGNNGTQSAVYLNKLNNSQTTGTFEHDDVACDSQNTNSNANVRCFGGNADPTFSIKIADINADGAPDISVGNFGKQSAVYLNTLESSTPPTPPKPTGKFTQNTKCDDSDTSKVLCFGDSGNNTRSVTVADVNGDGALDIIVGRKGQQRGQVYLSKEGVFAHTNVDTNPLVLLFGSGDRSQTIHDIFVEDLDSDRYPDIVAVGTGRINDTGQKAIFFNQGAAFSPKIFGESKATNLAVKVVDLDGNGSALDLVAANDGGVNDGGAQVFTNPGAGIPGYSFYRTGAGARDVALGKLNTDEPLGLFVANSVSNTISVLKREGSVFTSLPPISMDSSPQTVITGTLHGNNQLDLIVTTSAPTNNVYVLHGDGAGGFPDASRKALAIPGVPLATAIQRLDANSSFDLVVASNQGNVSILTGTLQQNNAPTGTFWPQPRQIIQIGGSPQALAIGKIDTGSTFDLVVANGHQIVVLPGNGNGTFTKPPTKIFTPTIPATMLALSDMNGDEASDLVVASGAAIRIYFNDGAGGFAIGPDECNQFGEVICYAPGELGTIRSIAVADMDGDSFLDLVVGRAAGQSAIYLNNFDAAGRFSRSQVLSGGQEGAYSTAVGDLNNDGALDLVFGQGDGQSQIYLNDGKGGFTAAQPFGPKTGHASSLAVGDINNDGVLDVVVGDYYGQSAVYLNDPRHPGEFCENESCDGSDEAKVRRFGNLHDDITNVVVADLDGKQGLDLIVARSHGSNLIYFNDGHGNLPGAGRPIGSGTSTAASLAVGDLDNKHGPDIVIGDYLGQSRVYFNDGTGRFTIKPLQPIGLPGASTTSVALGDMDGHNGLDIIVGNLWQPGAVYLNNGAGIFTKTGDLVKPFGTAEDGIYTVMPVDADRDGQLDLVVGNDHSFPFAGPLQNRVYLNHNGTFEAREIGQRCDHFFSPAACGITLSIAAADLNGDGAPDLVAANLIGANTVYYSDGGGKYPVAQGLKAPANAQVAVADMDGDGRLDLVTIGPGGQGSISLNPPSSTGVFTSTLSRAFTTISSVSSMAVADVDGAHGLDIIVGSNGRQHTIYLNDGSGNISKSARPFGGPADNVSSVAIVDINSDSYLDLAVGTKGQQSAVYLNDGHGNFDHDKDVDCDLADKVRCFGQKGDQVMSLVATDMNRDGAPDLLVGYSEESILYYNDGLGRFDRAIDCSTPAPTHRCIDGQSDLLAVGDINDDGYLDVINRRGSYLNDRHDNFELYRYLQRLLDPVQSLSLADINGDGALDLVVGRIGEQSAVYLNDRSGLFDARRTRLFGDPLGSAVSVATGDLNHDGAVDIVSSSTGEQIDIFSHPSAGAKLLPNNPPWVVVTKPGSTPDANFTTSQQFLSDPIIPITFKLYDNESDPVRVISATFSLDGGANWRTAVPTNTKTIDLATSPGGTAYTFKWDTFASNFFGASDNVVFRMIAYPGTRSYTGTVAGPYQQPYMATQTFPFRVRGTQVQVLPIASRSTHRVYLPLVARPVMVAGVPSMPAQPILDSGALVYRLQGDPPQGELLPYRTNAAGFLPGRPDIHLNDQLVALKPIAATESYTIYLTSAAPNAEGLNAHRVTRSGTQQLRVKDDNPLILFNLSIALEWNARPGDDYIRRLTADITRTSELLYDWSNGQAALGDITIYDNNSDQWDTADIRIYASNNVRPNADIGGIADRLRQNANPQARKGQIRIGAVWNRYGEPNGQIGEDWPHALAHELGHYLFFLDDNYLGLDQRRRLKPVENCPGVMSNPYIPDESEYRPRADWLADCSETLSNYQHRASDWEIMAAVFPWLRPPPQRFIQDAGNPGPSSLPLPVTKVKFVDTDSSTPIRSQIFTLKRDGKRYSSLTTRAFLFRDDRLIDLGVSVGSDVSARGAQSGDRLCAFDLPAHVLGCTKITPDSAQLQLGDRTNWSPEVIVVPEGIRNDGRQDVHVTVRSTDLTTGTVLAARLYPSGETASMTQTFTLPAISYTTRFTFTLEHPAEAGYVYVGVREASYMVGGKLVPQREVMAEYGLGGSPTRRSISADVPAISPDGQVVLYGPNLTFEVGQFYTLQAMTNLPVRPPPWGTPVGKAYRLTASATAPDLHNTSLNFSYLGRDVTPGENKPDGLRIYFLPEGDTQWRMLDTKVIRTLNVAIVDTQEPGIYMLMSSIPKKLTPIWDSFIYSGDELPVEEALASIAPFWQVVGTLDQDGTWLVYDRSPRGRKTLKILRPQRGYQIKVTQHVTLLLRGGNVSSTTSSTASLDSLPTPPAFYFGVIQPDATFIPTSGMPVLARVGDVLCGRGRTAAADGRIVYEIAVSADGPGVGGCGAPGRTVTFQVGRETMATTALWSNDWTHEFILHR